MNKLWITVIILLSTTGISAKNTEISSYDFSRFENKTDIKVQGIITPKVIRLTTNGPQLNSLLIEEKNGEIIPHRWQKITKNTTTPPFEITSVSSTFEGSKEDLIDENQKTYLTFNPDQNQHEITINFPKITKVSQVYLQLDEDIISPKYISIKADFGNNQLKNILHKVAFSSQISFPEVSIKKLDIKLYSKHFLRINQLDISDKNSSEIKNQLIFFAKEGSSYTLYSGKKFGQKKYVSKNYQPLKTNKNTPIFPLPSSQKNPQFNPDFDKDGIIDTQDLCPKIYDTQNLDIDKNTKGDACEDPDQDHINSHQDNCPFIYNPDQKDKDLDNLGDKCDKTEDRISENLEFLWYILFGLGGFCLGFLIWRNLKKETK